MTSTPAGSPRAGSVAADRREPRAVRTRTLILQAVRDALAEASIDDLNVSELSRRAGVHRVTFYGHWPDVRSAASDAFADVMDRILTIGEADVAAAASANDLAPLYEGALLAQLVEIRDHRATYRSLFGWSVFSQRLYDSLAERADLAVDALVRLGIDVPGVDSGIAAAHIAGGLVAASARWANSDDADAEAMAQQILGQMPYWWPRG
jgi:AcrR family transcriptional regulator